MAELLQRLGAEVKWNGNRITINPSVDSVEADYDLVSKMRASILVLGPLVARYGKAKVAMPGGCNIGHRKIDIHLSGLQALGAEIRIESGFVIAEARKGLTGTTVNLPIPSVGATENLLMAAVLARGITEIENAAREPEVVDLANFLLRMGARIDGAATSRIVVEGVDELKGVEYKPIPDRIEAGTFIIAGLITGGKIKIRNVVPDHLSYFIQKLGEAGARIKVRKDEIAVYPSGRLTGVDVATFPYPGFPTDLQPQTMALLATAEGTSVITENIFDNRFLHADELIRMGARIEVNGKHAIVSGTEKLFGVPVRAMDLRGGAALVLAGLAAEGHTDVYDAYHIFRGYENFVQKLLSLGAEIESVVE
jgi:UDP-N-acetylglucosamine 1-carboxyvinyltransferase